MADVNRGNRPLSPHISIYRPQLNSAMSIFHRITGCGLAITGALVVWWFVAAATGRGSFALANGVLSSWFGGLVFFLSLLALWYHFFNGIRHLFWDAGRGFDLEQVARSGYATFVAAGVMTVITLIATI